MEDLINGNGSFDLSDEFDNLIIVISLLKTETVFLINSA